MIDRKSPIEERKSPMAPAEPIADQNVETLNLVVELGETSLSKIDQIFRE